MGFQAEVMYVGRLGKLATGQMDGANEDNGTGGEVAGELLQNIEIEALADGAEVAEDGAGQTGDIWRARRGSAEKLVIRAAGHKGRPGAQAREFGGAGEDGMGQVGKGTIVGPGKGGVPGEQGEVIYDIVNETLEGQVVDNRVGQGGVCQTVQVGAGGKNEAEPRADDGIIDPIDKAGFVVSAKNERRKNVQLVAIGRLAVSLPFSVEVHKVVGLYRGAVENGNIAAGVPRILLGALPDFVPRHLRIDQHQAIGMERESAGEPVENSPTQEENHGGNSSY